MRRWVSERLNDSQRLWKFGSKEQETHRLLFLSFKFGRFLPRYGMPSRKPLNYRADRDLALSEQSAERPWWEGCNHGGSFQGQCWPGSHCPQSHGPDCIKKLDPWQREELASCSGVLPILWESTNVLSSRTFLTTNLFPPHKPHLDKMSQFGVL